mmetsp:Transcript_15863/g.51232  ORF Transcript_15863/g.51232 Transcript_15863/m.51232 type:complete len:230 (-) Transcript_15863:435-1124(-)
MAPSELSSPLSSSRSRADSASKTMRRRASIPSRAERCPDGVRTSATPCSTCTHSRMSCSSSASASLRVSASSNSARLRWLSVSSSCSASACPLAASSSRLTASEGPGGASRHASPFVSAAPGSPLPWSPASCSFACARARSWPLRASASSARAARSSTLSLSFCAWICSGESSVLTTAAFLIAFARTANWSVDLVSAAFCWAGEQATSSSVLELPPSDSCRMRVSFEFR